MTAVTMEENGVYVSTPGPTTMEPLPLATPATCPRRASKVA